MHHSKLPIMLLCLLATGALSHAQPSDARDTPKPGDPANGQPVVESEQEREPRRGRLGIGLQIDPEALRIRLLRSIDRGELMLERYRAALQLLDEGASAPEVLNELRTTGTDRVPRENGRPEREHDRERSEKRAGEMHDREAILRFLQSEFPQLWHNLAPIIKENPGNAERLLSRMAPQIREILFLQKSQPVLAQIKTEQMHVGLDFVEATREYRILLANPDASPGRIDTAHAELVELATKRFDVELRAKQYEISRLEQRLTELKNSVAQIEERRDREIAQMVDGAARLAERQNRQHRSTQDDRTGPSRDD